MLFIQAKARVTKAYMDSNVYIVKNGHVHENASLLLLLKNSGVFPFFLLFNMTKTTIMKRIVALFKKTHEKKEEQPPYPPELESTYKITKKTLGVGSFAVVKECIHRSTHQPFALKIILKKAIAGKFL